MILASLLESSEAENMNKKAKGKDSTNIEIIREYWCSPYSGIPRTFLCTTLAVLEKNQLISN